jgi:hypothetical protein
MSQKHVNLLMEAVALNTDDKYLCNRIGYITGWFFYPALRNTKYGEDDYVALTEVIQLNIMSNLSSNYDEFCGEQTYESTTFYEQEMTREQWAKEILAPLALELSDEELLEEN